MDAKLKTFADAWGVSPKDWPKLRGMATAYVTANKAALSAKFDKLTREDLVAVVGMARKQGREDDKWAAEAWLLSEYEPQAITGAGLGG